MRTIPAMVLAFSALLAPLSAHADPADPLPPEDSSILRLPREPGQTQLRISPPAQVVVTVLDGDVSLGRFSVGATLGLTTGKQYDIVATRGGATVFRARVQASGGTVELAWDADGTPVLHVASGPVVAVPVPATQPGPYVPPPPPSMPQVSFDLLIALLESTDFDSERVQMIRTAAGRNRFTVEQAGRLLDCLEMGANRLAAAKALKPRLVDPENGILLARHFDFSSDKEKVAALFAR